VTASTVTGLASGACTAKGGNGGGGEGGGGGGGRIYFSAGTNTYAGTKTVTGGTGNISGAAGSSI
jgi:hypothetical protein